MTEKVQTIKNQLKKKRKSAHDIHNIYPRCPHCGSENVYGISRIIGYFSVIENWNPSKKAELKRRQKGNYWTKEIN